MNHEHNKKIDDTHGNLRRRKFAHWRVAALALALGWASGAAPVMALPHSTLAPAPAVATVEQLRELVTAGRYDAALDLAAGLTLDQLDAPMQVETQRLIGYAHARLGNYALARDHYAAALEAADYLAEAQRARIHYTLAQFDFALGDFRQARDHLLAWRGADGAEPQGAAAYVLLGQTYFKLGDSMAAIEALQAGVRCAEDLGEPVAEHWLRLLHHLYVTTGQWPQAVGVLEDLARSYPSAEYEQLLAQARAGLG